MSREQDVMHLFKNVDINDPEMLQLFLFKNFAEIESHMQGIQGVLKEISGGSIIDVTAKIEQSFADISAALIAAAAAQEAADGKIQGFFQNDEPTTNMGFGDIWIDTDGATPLDESCIYRYEDKDGGSKGDLAWHACPTSAVGMVYLEAYVAKLTADDALANNSLYIQYSSDGEDWHNIFDSENDMYMRQKVGDKGTWSEAMRIKGVDGHTPIKGTDYFDGIDGQNGTNSYLWVRYSDEADGNPMTASPIDAKYIGIVTTTESSAPDDYRDYSWSLIKGTDGVPGEPGVDGQTSYLHIKYSDDGKTFTPSSPHALIEQDAWENTYYIMDSSFAGQGFRATDGMAGATKAQFAVMGTDPYIFRPDYIDFHIYDDDEGKPGRSLSTPGFARITGSEWPSTPDWIGGEITLDTPLKAGGNYWLVWLSAGGYSGAYVKLCVSLENPYLDGCYMSSGSPQPDTDVAFRIETHPKILGESPGAYIGTYVDFAKEDSVVFEDYTWNKVHGEDGHDVEIFTSQPDPPYAVGDLWVEPNNDTRICVVAKGVGTLFDDADWQETAATKITTFYQAEVPVAKAKGDLWVDTNDNNKMYRAASQGADAITPGEWESVRDLGVTRSAATYIIADEATSNNPKNADYIVPLGSTSAQTIINEAINSLPSDGGKVLLLEGTYVVDDSVVVSSNVAIEGQGQNTEIKPKNNAAINAVIKNSDQENGNNNITIASLSVNGNQDNGNGSSVGISFKNVANSNIYACNIKGANTGVQMFRSNDNSISNNIVDDNSFAGIYLGGCQGNSVIGNFVQYNRNNGLSIYSDLSEYPNEVESIGNTIMGNNLSGNDSFGLMLRGNECTVNGNIINSNGDAGIELGGDKNAVSGNVCKLNGDEGISFYGSHNVVSSNVCSENSQSAHDTYANISLNSGGSYNSIQNNNCRRGSLAKQPKYGIGILDSVCEKTMVTNNDLYTGGATASFYDGGTGTKTTATNRT